MLSHRQDMILIYLHVASSIKKFEPVPFPVGESLNTGVTRAHLFWIPILKASRYHRNQLAQTEDFEFSFMAVANYVYQWNTYLVKRKWAPAILQSALAYVYITLFDLIGCWI